MAKPTYKLLISINEDERKTVERLRSYGYTIVGIFREGLKLLVKANEEEK